MGEQRLEWVESDAGLMLEGCKMVVGEEMEREASEWEGCCCCWMSARLAE
jgi:hypothetical protein